MEDKDNTILVVDDSSIIRDILSMHVEELGYSVASAEDGQRAVEMVKELDFDLIILDIIMPVMDGYKVLEYLKTSDTFEHIPVIMITDVDEIESIARCIELGAEDYLPKNFNLAILKARIEASLEKKRLRDLEKKEKKRMLQELKIAHDIQQSLLPKETPFIEGIEISATNLPYDQVGGDFFDFINVAPNYLGLVMADVSGKGVPAALFMALSRAFLRASTMSYQEPGDAITQANALILEDSKSGMFVTVFYAILDIKNRTLTYLNAGHNPPILYNPAKNSVEILEADGIALGVVDDVEFEVKTAALNLGDVLVLYTDGITEAFNPQKEEYGEERLIQLITENASLSADDLIQKVKDDVFAFAGDEPQADDFTLMVVKNLSM